MLATATLISFKPQMKPPKPPMFKHAGKIPAALLLTFIALSGQAAISKPQDYLTGMQAYNSHDYVTAKKWFARMIQDTPDDSLGHYYMANTMVFLKDTTGAMKEYQTAIDNADSDDLRLNCESAMKTLKKAGAKGAAALLSGSASVSAKAAAAGSTSAAGSATATAASTSQAATSAAAAALTPATAAVQPESLSLLQRQAEDRKSNALREQETQQKAILDAAKMQADRIKADHTVDPLSYRRGGRYWSDQLKKEGNDQAAEVMKRANLQAADYKKLADEKKAVLDDVTNNLDDQMNQTVGTSKIHLKKEGTNLNVRNYEFSH
jgi:hypothetical protein